MGPVWRIRHPDGAYYISFLVVQEPRQTLQPHHLGLTCDKTPPEAAMQFGREVDARQFAAAFLQRQIPWQFEPDFPPPPAWSCAAPPDHLLEACRAELGAQP